MCYNEYNDCKTRRILENEASKNKIHLFEGGLKSGTQGSIDSNIGTSKIKDALYDQVNIDAPRSRLIINPDYVSSLDDSDGTKQFDE